MHECADEPTLRQRLLELLGPDVDELLGPPSARAAPAKGKGRP